MKETVKASIGGYAFTLDADAYEILNLYLDNLKLHFQNKEDGNEIIADIEARMCELLQMKSSKQERIITDEDARSIIDIMGNPVDFVDEATTEDDNKNRNSSQKADNSTVGKKLYRDTENAILGGVCGGLARYFNFDVVFVRIAYASTVAFSGFIADKLGLYFFLSYFILWIAMPKAKTMKQKLAMSGADPSIEAIENRTAKISRKNANIVGTVLGTAIRVVTGIILILIGISILIASSSILFFPTELDLPSISEALNIFNIYSGNISLVLGTICLLPAICILYLGIKIFTKITPKDLVIFGISFLIWFGACAYISIITIRQAKNYQENAEFTDKADITTKSDTLYIKLDDYVQEASYRWKNGGNRLYVLDSTPRSWFVLPTIKINQDSTYTNFEIEIEKIAFGKNERIAENKAKKAKLNYTIQDSTLSINPYLYNKHTPWNGELFEIQINCPINKTVILDKSFTYRGENFIGWQFH